MQFLIAPLFAILLTVGMGTPTVQAESKTFTCEPIYFPDGTEGVAIVRVDFSNHGLATRTVMVTVDYYTQGCAHFLGQYEDQSSSSDFPADEYEAEEYALEHFYDRR